MERLLGARDVEAEQLNSDRATGRRIVRVARVVSLSEQGSDLDYWLTRPPEARVAAVEAIRREYHGWEDDDAEPRLQRVCRVLKR